MNLSRHIECTVPRVNPGIIVGFGWLWKVSIGSLVVTNVLFQRGMLTRREAIHVWGQGVYETISVPSSQFEPRPALKGKKWLKKGTFPWYHKGFFLWNDLNILDVKTYLIIIKCIDQ
jgi:hypothetical protein